MENLQYILDKDAGHTARSGAIAFVIDIINKEIKDLEPETKKEKNLFNQIAKINNRLVKKFNNTGGDASGGYIELKE